MTIGIFVVVSLAAWADGVFTATMTSTFIFTSS